MGQNASLITAKENYGKAALVINIAAKGIIRTIHY